MKQPFSTSAKNALIGRFDPTARLVACLIFAVVVAVLNSAAAASLALIIALALIPLSNPPLEELAKRWLAINFFIFFIWLLTPWATPGEPIYSGSFITKEGVDLCVLITLKANALFFAFIVLISSQTFSQLAHALKAIKIPEKLCILILFTARGIDIFFGEYERLKTAALLRGFVKKNNLRTYKTIAAIVSMLFVRAAHKGQVMQDAMMLRGFDGTIRTLSITHWKIADSALILSFAVICIILGWLSLA